MWLDGTGQLFLRHFLWLEFLFFGSLGLSENRWSDTGVQQSSRMRAETSQQQLWVAQLVLWLGKQGSLTEKFFQKNLSLCSLPALLLEELIQM